MRYFRIVIISMLSIVITTILAQRTIELNQFSDRISSAFQALQPHEPHRDSFIDDKTIGYEELKNVILDSSYYEPPFPIRGISLSARNGDVFFCMVGPGGKDFYQGIATLELVKSWVDQSKIFVFFGEYYGGSKDHFCDLN